MAAVTEETAATVVSKEAEAVEAVMVETEELVDAIIVTIQMTIPVAAAVAVATEAMAEMAETVGKATPFPVAAVVAAATVLKAKAEMVADKVIQKDTMPLDTQLVAVEQATLQRKLVQALLVFVSFNIMWKVLFGPIML